MADTSGSESEINSSDNDGKHASLGNKLAQIPSRVVKLNLSSLYVQLQDAFSKGLLKPGLNAVVQTKKQFKNCVVCTFVKLSWYNFMFLMLI
jgi:hypothetical protein